MAVQLRAAFGLACIITPLLSLGAAAEGKRPWVDPPTDLGTRAGAVPADTSAKGRPAASPTEQADKPALATKAPTGTEDGATAKPTRTVRNKSAPGRAAVARARPNSRLQQAREARPGAAAPKTRLATSGEARAAQEKRLSLAGRPLELMNLQTIELPDGRRFNVLTRPDRRMVEEFLARP
jgi:hypothetical protein